MSTPRKLLLFIGAPLAVLMLVFFVIFPGIPAYVKVKLKYDNIDSTSESFSIQAVPSDYKTFSLKGLSFRAPSDFELSGSTLRASGGSGSFSVFRNSTSNTAVLSEYIEDYDPWAGYECGEKEFRKLFEKLGREYLSPVDSNSRFLFFVRDELKAKDCLRLRGKALKAFKECAEIKDTSYDTEEAWRIDNSGFTGHVCYGTNAIMPEPYWTVTSDPDSSGEYYFIMMRNIPDDTVKNIISSIKYE